MRTTADPGGTRRSAVRRSLPTVLALLTATVAGVVIGPPAASADWVRDEQWYLSQLDAGTAWQYASGRGVVVAVVDSGVDATHPDLVGQVLPGADFVRGSPADGRDDPVGHGTSVAAIIAGRGDDGDGVKGLAPKAKILPVRVLDDDNKYDDAAVVAQGVRWAVDHGASVVNLSLGGAAYSHILAASIAYAATHDVVVVACTGNRSGTSVESGEVWYPAREPGVIAVAGLAADPVPPSSAGIGGSRRRIPSGGKPPSRTLWHGSVTGPATVLTAPAARLTGARPGGYWRIQGTSFAAPLVAATAALIRSRWPELNATNVANRLVQTADDLGVPGRDSRYGFGAVSPASALAAPIPWTSMNPLLASSAPVLAGGPGPTTRMVPAARRLPAASISSGVNATLTGSAALLVAAVAIIALILRHRARRRCLQPVGAVRRSAVCPSPRSSRRPGSLWLPPPQPSARTRSVDRPLPLRR